MAGRKIYNAVYIDIFTGDTLWEDSYLYEGPLALCDGEPEPEPSPEPNSESDTPPEPSSEPSPEPDTSPSPPRQYKYKTQDEAEDAYKELERKLGHQGTELGTLKQVIERLTQQPANGNTPPVKPPEPPVEDKPPVKPRIEDFNDLDAFEEAKDAWIVETAEYRISKKNAESSVKAEQERAQAQTVEQQRKEVQKVIDTHLARVEKAKESDPGLEEIINDGNMRVSAPMSWIIMQAEEGPRAIRYLHENPKEMERIFNLAPTVRLQDGRVIPVPGKPFNRDLAIMEMGKIVERLAHQPEPKSKKQSDAPAPHTPVGGNKGTPASEDFATLASTNPKEYLRRTGVIAAEE